MVMLVIELEISLLSVCYTGMRIGEVLGLRHEDIYSQGVNEIHVIPEMTT